MLNIRAKAEYYFNDTIELRRTLHRHPEISGQEVRTSRFVKGKLDEYGVMYKELPGHGILGIIEGKKPGKVFALRADMDGLPIQETSNIEYCSQEDGCGHLCGHDCHTASLLTAARILNECKEDISGKIILIFQPSEENLGPGTFGAEEMVKHGAMDGADAVFGVHVLNEIEAGKVSVQAGPRMAASLCAAIEVFGVGGHGGMPHKCVDAILAGSAIVMNLQSIVSRETNSQESVSITVGTFHGGSSQFAVSDYAKMELTIKFINAKLAEQLKESIIRIAKDTANAYRAKCNVTIRNYLKPVINDPVLSAIAENSLKKLYGEESVAKCDPWTASEDFGEYAVNVPGVFAFIGGRNEKKGCIYPAHHPCFNVDEICLERASALYAQFAIDFLNS